MSKRACPDNYFEAQNKIAFNYITKGCFPVKRFHTYVYASKN